VYLLTRDDGEELRLSGGVWEAALELAYLFGWRPAGTEAPPAAGRRAGRSAARAGAWDRQDYFTLGSQHVAREDACALAAAVHCALARIPARASCAGDRGRAAHDASRSPVPSRTSAIADGLSLSNRKLMSRFATFAARDGFTIASVV
jgi:hypothetical protein